MAIKQYPGAAEQLTLNANINNSVTTFVVTETPTSNWPTAGNQYVVSIRKTDDTNEEKILCNGTSRSASSFSTVTRGFDGTTAVSHTAGEIVRVVWDAASATDASRHIYTTTDDDHTQYLNTTRHDVTARHAFGAALGTPAAAADVTTSAGAGSSGVPARSDHFHKLGTGAINAAGMFSSGVVDAAAIGAGAVGSSEVADDAVDTAAIQNLAVTAGKIAADTITASQIAADAIGTSELAANAVGTSELADNAVDTAAIVDNAVTRAKLATGIIASASVTASESTTSLSYTDLSGGATGPAVTLTTGTSALVTFGAQVYNSTLSDTAMSVAVSGATTLAASDGNGRRVSHFDGSAASLCHRTLKLTGLTAGSNTFTVKYKNTDGGTGAWEDRDITVTALPT